MDTSKYYFTMVRDYKILHFLNPGTPCSALSPFPGVCAPLVLLSEFNPKLVCICILLWVSLLRGHPPPAVTQTEALPSPQHSWNTCEHHTSHGVPASYQILWKSDARSKDWARNFFQKEEVVIIKHYQESVMIC